MGKERSELKVVVGLGKTGMSCVRYLVDQGFTNLIVMDSKLDPLGLKELKKNFPEVKIHLGGFDKSILLKASMIVVSPGVALSQLPVDECLSKGIEITGDVELFVRKTKKPILAITGSNGKSTVTVLVGNMIERAGERVSIGGNIGVPVLDLLYKDKDKDKEADFYVLELSSFQLETTKSLKAEVAVILNVFSDHMDRYESFSQYLSAKQKIYKGCKSAVVNRDDDKIYKELDLPPRVVGFSSGKPKAGDFGIDDGFLMYGEEKLLPISDLKIKGSHNVKNALAAFAVGFLIDLSFGAMIEALRDFPGLPHRLQWLDKIDDVDWYNDSKATNVGAVKSSIESVGLDIKGRVILIAGGVSKGDDFSLLNDVIAKYVGLVVLIGKDADLIERSLDVGVKILRASSMEEAVKICKKDAKPGDAVLLSPVCASFDMFDNFEHRGEVFISEVSRSRESGD